MGRRLDAYGDVPNHDTRMLVLITRKIQIMGYDISKPDKRNIFVEATTGAHFYRVVAFACIFLQKKPDDLLDFRKFSSVEALMVF